MFNPPPPPAVVAGAAAGVLVAGAALADGWAGGGAAVRWRPPSRKMPSPPRASTTTTNSRRCCPLDSSMARPRYLSRRLGRSQNGIGEDLSVADGAAPDSSERPVPPPENHPFPPAGRDADPAPPDAFRRTGGWAVPRTGVPEVPLPLPLPDGRGARGGGADLPLTVPPLAAEPRAQPADVPAGVDPPRGGNGGAARLAPPLASGHCLLLPLAGPPPPPARPPPRSRTPGGTRRWPRASCTRRVPWSR